MGSEESDTGNQDPAAEPGPGASRGGWHGTADGQGQVHQAGRNQYITHNYYLTGGPPAAGDGGGGGGDASDGDGGGDTAGAETDEGGGVGWFAGHRAAWISALATVLAALIAALATAAQGGGSDDASGTAPSGTAPSSAASSSAAPSGAASSGGQGRAAGGSERWRGELVLAGLDGSGDKDLDAAEPVGTGSPDRNDLYISSLYDRFTLSTHYGTEVAPWKGSGTPGLRDCARTLGDDATRALDLSEGQDVCVRTGGGRVARLTVTRLPHSGVEPRVRFDAVVWNTTRKTAPETASPSES